MNHLKIQFTDGSVEELDSKFSFIYVVDEVLHTYTDYVGGYRDIGPSYPIANIHKYEWIKGYK